MHLGSNSNPCASSDSDEDDNDYIPPNGSDSEHSKEETNPVAQPVDARVSDEEKQRRDALWASFQASVANPTKAAYEPTPKRMVKVQKRFRFAGDEVIEVVEVPEDSPDAKKWPIWKDTKEEYGDSPAQDVASQGLAPEISTEPPSAVGPSSLTPTLSSGSAPVPKQPPKRPGPRKPKTVLAPVPGPSKAKKLTTLDKSAMDWRLHLQEAGSPVQEELEANRRGGGYLEKVEFLKRVEERKEEQLEAAKSNKRRKL